jgi:phosphoribosylanthranilate isomerase
LERILLHRPKLKYCGNRSFEDWCTVNDSKADFIGVIFAPSKRKVIPEQVKEWMRDWPLSENKKLVGVFVHATVGQIQEVLDSIPLDIIQCHGDETALEVEEIKLRTGKSVWKAIHHDKESINKMKSFKGIADGFVIDTKTVSSWGGTGTSFDWHSIPDYIQEATEQDVICFIAGGVKPSNMRTLVRYQPSGIDISSGIEQGERKQRELINKIEKEVDCYEHNISR